MSGNSRNSLLNSMIGRSITLGWDAISACQGSSFDPIIENQFLQYLTEDEVFRTKEEDIPGNHEQTGIGIFIHASRLVLGAPQLTLANATLDDAAASLEIPFLSGYFFTLLESTTAPTAISEYNNVFPGSQFNLNMALPLQQSSDSVSGQANIYLDLADGEPDSVSVNLVTDDNARRQIGQSFLDRFSSPGVAGGRYVLGSLNDSDTALCPVAFRLRTQPAPDGTGDGAMLVFIQTRSGAEGTLPSASSGFPYLIPDDTADGNDLYSGSVIFSSYTLCNDLVAPAYQAQLTENGLAFQVRRASDASDQICSLIAAQGTAPSDALSMSWTVLNDEGDEYDYTASLQSFDLPYAPQNGSGFSLTPAMNSLRQVWNNTASCTLLLSQITPPGRDSEERNINIAFYSHSNFMLSADQGNVMKFTLSLNPRDIEASLPGISKQLKDWGWTCDQTYELQDNIEHCISQVLNSVSTVDIPGIPLFTQDILQFPNGNALQLGDVAMPGDMALFGRLAPSSSSQSLTPPQATVSAGQSCTFTLTADGASGINWSIQNAQGMDVAGRILPGDDGTAVYRAPDRSALSTASMMEIVSVRFTNSDGSQGTIGAAVIVSGNVINLNPGFILATAGQAPITFTVIQADGLDATVNWTHATETGSPAPGMSRASCSPALEQGQSWALQTVSAATDTGTAQASMLVMADGTAPSLLVGGGSWETGDPSEVVTGGLYPLPPYGQRQLTALSGNPDSGGYVDITGSCTWQILDDPPQGSINQGLYTAPSTISTSCVTIMATQGDSFGYTVVPLAPGN